MSDRIGTKPGPFLTSEELNCNLQSGNQSIITYQGSRAEMVSQRQTDLQQGATIFKLTAMGDGNYQLISTFNYDLISGSGGGQAEKPADVHDLEDSMETVSVYNSPKLYAEMKSAFSGSDTSTKQAISHVWKTVGKYQRGDWGDYKDVSTGLITQTALDQAENHLTLLFPSNATAQLLMLSLLRNVACLGIETVVQWNSVYRRSITAATPIQAQASRTGEGLIWTSAEITAFENLPAFWWFTLPAGLQWMKSPVNVNLVAGGKTRIDYHYIGFKQASGMFYSPYADADLLP